MGIFDLFSGNTNTSGTTSGTSTGTSNVAGTTGNIAQSTPFLQWLASQTAQQGYGGFGPGNQFISQSADPVSASDIGALRDPMAAQQYQQASAMLQPQFQDQLAQLKGSMSANPYASSNGGAEARLRAQQGQTLGGLAGQITSAAWAPAAGVAQQNAQRMQTAGTGLNQGYSSYLSSVPGLINSAGATNVGSGTSNQVGQTSGTTTGTNNSTTTYNPSPFSIVAGGLGAIGKMFGFKHGGAIRGYDAGGSVSEPMGPLGGTSGPGNENPMSAMPPWQPTPTPMMAAPSAPPMAMVAPQAPIMPFQGQFAPQGGMPGMPANPAMPKMFASGGAVGGDSEGIPPAHHDFPGKVMHAFKTFHQMRKHAQDGGVMEDNGGWQTDTSGALGAPIDPQWGDNVVNQANYNQGAMDSARPGMMSRFTSGLDYWNKAIQPPEAPKPAGANPQNAMSMGNPALDALGRAMSAYRPTAADGGVMRGFEGGGVAEDYRIPGVSPLGDNPEMAPRDPNATSSITPPPVISPFVSKPPAQPVAARSPQYRSADDVTGALGYKAPSKWDNLFTGLMNTPSGIPGLAGPWSGVGKSFSDDQDRRLKVAQMVAQVGESTGQLPGGVMTEAARHARAMEPSQIEQAQAAAAASRVAADKEFLLEIEKRKAEYAKELDLAKQRAEIDQMLELRERLRKNTQPAASDPAQPNARLKWVPAPDATTTSSPMPPAPTAPVAPVEPAQAPIIKNSRGVPLKGTPQTPWASKEQAGFGQYYIGADGNVYRRGNMRSGDSRYYPTGG